MLITTPKLAPQLRLGFVGLGWIGRMRLQAVSAHPAIEVAALYDPEPAALQAARALAPKARAVSSLPALLDEDLGAVVIATPNALHAQQTLSALEHSLPVFCQKPLARDSAETRGILQSARERDRNVGIDLCYRNTNSAVALKRWVDSGRLGEIFCAKLVFHNAYGPDKAWFYDPRQAGGGALMDLGTHLIDLLLWVLDYPNVRSVTSQLFSAGRPLVDRSTCVEDFVAAQLLLEGGAQAQLECSWRLHAGSDCVIELSLYGTHGGVCWHNRAGSFYDFGTTAFVGTTAQPLSAAPDAWGGRTLEQWALRVARDPGFDASAERYLEISRVIDAIYEAAGDSRGLLVSRADAWVS